VSRSQSDISVGRQDPVVVWSSHGEQAVDVVGKSRSVELASMEDGDPNPHW